MAYREQFNNPHRKSSIDFKRKTWCAKLQTAPELLNYGIDQYCGPRSQHTVASKIPMIEVNSSIVQKIRELGSLPIGWHYGSGTLARGNIISLAEELAETALSSGTPILDAFPGKDGQITVVLYIGETDHSFQIQADGSVHYWQEIDPDSDEQILGFSQAVEKIKKLSQ